MKKVFVTLAAVLCLGLTGCNKQIGFGSYSFHYVHIQLPGQAEPAHLKVTSWQNDDGGIELKTESYGTILVGDGTYVAYDNEKCPICGTVSYK